MEADHTIRTKFFHPPGSFIEFKREEVAQSIPARFEQVVRMYPNRLAVKTKSRRFTYEELNKAANCVAHAILAQRGERHEAAALLFEHDVALMVAIMGVLKTGRFFVPLDPLLPQERNSYMLEDSQAGLIVTNNRDLSFAKELTQNTAQLINIDELDSSLPDENLRLSIPPETLARLLYTSGSTGQPKGVVQNHRNVLHVIMRRTNTFGIRTEDRVALLTSGTSQAVNTIFGALLTGARLCPFNVKEKGATQLATWLIQEGITIYFSSASLFRQLVGALTGKEEFPRLRLIRLASETVTKSDVELWRKYFSSDCILGNGLGTTETGPSVLYFMDKSTRIDANTVPIGYPVQDMEILLLDDGGREVGLNRVGEIAVRSRYLSLGYWRRPELTRAKFLPDPDGGDKRIYLTGDLGRKSKGGCFELLGRKDFQVKVRGYTVEPAEVEISLLNHSAIKEAVVVAQEAEVTGKPLVAYIVTNRKPAPSIGEIRRFLSGKLPDYMIPSAFVMLDELPLLPNGKVDRKALPDPGNSRPGLDTPFVAARTPVEGELAKIWAEVFSLDKVGIHDNFFDLGGHSLRATQVISRIINTFRVELPIKSLFESPTVADMAMIIIQNETKKIGQKDLARMLNELEALSDEEAQRLLADESK
ncbi:MAG: non-ribosomal peptide synthetase [Deltaproteobacteria bacterium]|nr:non-ribosomal peptide synthetase [Deltaproteobacteria bacterium]